MIPALDHRHSGLADSAEAGAINITGDMERKVLPLTAMLDPHPVRDDIAGLRCNLPFVPILPFPRASFIVSLATGITGDIKIPDNAVLVKLVGQFPFFLTDKGAANGNTSAQEATNGNNQFSADILIALESDWYYIAQMKSLSVRNPNATTQFIGARFIMRDEV